jgi:hypothetical protein
MSEQSSSPTPGGAPTSFSHTKSSLSEKHRRELVEGSGLSDDVIAERGYRTVTSAIELLELGFADYQAERTPGYLLPVHDTRGRNGRYYFKPDRPRSRDGKPVKYESQPDRGVVLDVPPRCQATLTDWRVPLLVTEGPKKSDLLAQLGYTVLDLVGVWCWGWTPWKESGQPIDDWQPILPSLPGRTVCICFDSDAVEKDGVRAAEQRLADFLEAHGAHVFIVRLPSEPDGAKNGADDFVVRHGADAFEQLVRAARPAHDDSLARNRQLEADNAELKRQLHELAQLRRDRDVDSTDLRVGWAVADELGWRRSTGITGPVEVNLDRMCDQSGVSADTVGKSLKRFVAMPGSPLTKLSKWRTAETGEQHKVLLLDTPAQPDAGVGAVLAALRPAFPKKRPHGGKRTHCCPRHLDAELVRREHLLHFDCGCVLAEAEALLLEQTEPAEVKPQLAVLVTTEPVPAYLYAGHNVPTRPAGTAAPPAEPLQSKTATCGFSAAPGALPGLEGRALSPSHVVKQPHLAVLVGGDGRPIVGANNCTACGRLLAMWERDAGHCLDGCAVREVAP